MPAQYLVNLGVVQLYFDAERRRCQPPGGDAVPDGKPVHFVRVRDSGVLLTEPWDDDLAAFTPTQRENARLYRRIEV